MNNFFLFVILFFFLNSCHLLPKYSLDRKSEKDKMIIANNYFIKGIKIKKRNNLDSAFYYFSLSEKTNPLSKAAKFEIAKIYIQKKDFQNALNLLHSIKDSNNNQILANTALLEKQLKNYPESRNLYLFLIQKTRYKNSNYIYNLFDIYTSMQDWKGLYNTMETVFDKNGNINEDYILNRLKLYEPNNKDKNSMLWVYKKILENNIYNKSNWYQYIQKLIEINKLESIDSTIEKYKKQFTEDVEILEISQLINYNKKDFLKSIMDFEKIKVLDTVEKDLKPMSIFLAAESNYNLKNYTQSFGLFDKLLQQSPNEWTYYNNYAYYLYSQNTDLEKAKKFSQKALLLNPNNATNLDTYLCILTALNHADEALPIAQKMNNIIQKSGLVDLEIFQHLFYFYTKINDDSMKKFYENKINKIDQN